MREDIILLVEDNADHSVLVQAMLEYRGLGGRFYVTQTMAEAKSYLLGEWPFDDPERSPCPTLIILDHWLDDGTGLELLEWLGDFPELSRIPIIVFTACRDPQVKERALALGVREFLTKPEGFEDLGLAIDEVIRPRPRKSGNGADDDSNSAKAG